MDLSREEPYNVPRLVCNFLKLYWKMIFLVVYPLALMVILLGPWTEGVVYYVNRNPISGNDELARYEFKYIYRTMFVFVLMCGYWLTECIPIHVTGMIPLFAFPLMGVLSSIETTGAYLMGANMTFIASIFLAFAIEHSGLHARLAYWVILSFGTEPRLLHFGVLTATYVLSMWLVSTATAAMLCPVVKALIETFETMGIGSFYKEQTETEKDTHQRPRPTQITVGYYLGICFSANIGGMSTLVGSPTNLLYKNIVESRFAKAEEEIVSFIQFTAFGIPVMFIVNSACWFCLQITCMGLFRPDSVEAQSIKLAKQHKQAAHQAVKDKLRALGGMSWHECWVGLIFLASVFLMVFRKPDVFDGWADVLELYGPNEFSPNKQNVTEPVILILATFLMLIIPDKPECFYMFSKNKDKRPKKNSRSLVPWKILLAKTPWGLLFLIGGGKCLAMASTKTKMSSLIGEALMFLESVNHYVVMLICCFCMITLTQFASNMTSINILIPIVCELAVVIKCHPGLIGHPTSLMSSCSFLLPIATASNLVAQAYANVPIKDFLRSGTIVAVLAYVIIIVLFVTYGMLIWGEVLERPPWAE